MCYAIPGKIVGIADRRVTVDYFGENKQAINEFIELSLGDFIYAQGGYVINRISSDQAKEILRTWEDLFFKLKEKDLRLSQPGKTLHQIANSLRQRHLGNSCCVHGIIEFSNYCRNNCHYCGIRVDNQKLERYRMSVGEIATSADYAVNQLGFKALVLQSGEDLFYDEDKLVKVVAKIKERCAVLLFVSIGERELPAYEKLYQAGARGVLLRFETSNPVLYEKIRPGHTLGDRLSLIRSLYQLGYLVITGALVGLPGQSEADTIEDIRLTKELKAEMYSFGPLIPHPATPLADSPQPALEAVLNVIARARIMDPGAKIVATTALETLDPVNGARRGLLAGANSMMVNVTPEKYRRRYDIYPNRTFAEIKQVIDLLYSLGRAPTDLPAGRQAWCV